MLAPPLPGAARPRLSDADCRGRAPAAVALAGEKPIGRDVPARDGAAGRACRPTRRSRRRSGRWAGSPATPTGAASPVGDRSPTLPGRHGRPRRGDAGRGAAGRVRHPACVPSAAAPSGAEALAAAPPSSATRSR